MKPLPTAFARQTSMRWPHPNIFWLYAVWLHCVFEVYYLCHGSKNISYKMFLLMEAAEYFMKFYLIIQILPHK